MVDKLGLDDDKHHCNLKQAFKDFLNNSSFPALLKFTRTGCKSNTQIFINGHTFNWLITIVD